MSTRDHNIKTTLLNQPKYEFQLLPLLSKKTSNLRTHSKRGLMHSPLTEDKLQTDQWAFKIRQRIQAYVNQKENIPMALLSSLKNEIIQVFIKTLQENSCQHWTFLHDVLQLLVPFKDYLEFSEWDQELQHYMRRIWSHSNSPRIKELDVDILEILTQIFPKVVNYIEEEAGSSIQKLFPKFGISQKKKKKMIPKQLVPQNDDIFSTKLTKSKLTQPLTVLDLHRSIGTVAYDIAAYESFWGSCCGLTAQAVNVTLPEEILEPMPKAEEKEKIIEEKAVKNISVKISNSPDKIESNQVLSGCKAVDYYTKCQYLRRVEHLYFNIAPSCHYRPYDLVSVAKDKVNPEHYLFSSFGVLHVDKNSNSETYKLREWQRNAILWEAISEIPFFKNFLVSKIFYRWKISKSILKILKIKETLERTLIQSMPIYEAGLLQVSKLLNELVTLDFLPFQKDKCYTLPEFEDAVIKVQINAKEYLERFFRLCKVIVDVIMFESFKKLRFCEEQMTAKNMFSKDSLYQMKIKKRQRTLNFLKAKNETSHLGNFVMLINLMTVEYLFSISKSHICKFIHEVLRRKKIDNNKGFFCIKLIFNEEDQLEFSPPVEKCEESLVHNLQGIASLLCSKAIPLGILEMSKTKSSAINSDIFDSSEALKKYMRQFLCANPQLLTDSPDILKNLPFASHSQEILEDDFNEPIDLDKLRKTMPTKPEDMLGVATPDYMQRQQGKEFQLSGEGFLGQYTPLFASKLEEKLLADPKYFESIQLQTKLLSDAKKDLKEYVDSLDWLVPIYKTCKQWEIGSCSKLQHSPPQHIEQKLGELKTWGQKVKKMDTSFSTNNRLFWLDCSIIRDHLIPQLDSIYQALVEYFLCESKKTSIWFCKQIDKMAKTLDGKPNYVNHFAEYVLFFKKAKGNIPEYKVVVDNTKAIFEIIRTYHRPLTDVEFQHENNLWRQWEVLQVMMQNASEFVSTQSPIMERQMEDMFKKLEMQASEYCEEANSGELLDPNQNRSEMVDRIRQIRIKFYDTQQKLMNYSKYRKDICGESFDLSFLNELATKVDARNDLWKFLLQTIQSIDAWMLMPFKKIKFENAVKKINEWKAIAANLKSVLPPEDLVVEFWEQCLDKFLDPLPLLQIISSERHKVCHLKAIFDGMSAVYIRTKEYLVQELLSLNLAKHRDMIMSVHQMAIAEYDLEFRVKKMKKNWGGKMFKLLKYFPEWLNSTKGKNLGDTKKRKQSDLGYSKNIICPEDVYYILIDMELLKTELMDDSIILATMLSSSYLGDMRGQVENLAFALYQVEEIVDLWVSAQKKWMFLVKIFERPSMIEKFPELAVKFETSVHIKFKEWMRVVYADSKVLSISSRSITEKGYRFLQGEQLRNMFLNIIESMDDILKKFNFLLDESRMIFPRLFFLSDNELIDVLSISDDPHELPGVRKCFPGIDSITLTVLGTNQMSSKVAASELAINAHRSISIGFEGKHGEQVKLLRSVGPMKGIIQWLCDFESSMKDTMVDQLARCVVEKFKSFGLIKPVNEADGVAMTFSQWIKEFPLECLRLAEAITWEQQMRKFLQNSDRSAITKLCSDIQKQIYNLSHLPNWHYLSTPINLDDRRYYIRTLLIVLGINLRDLTEVFLENETIDLQCFEWQTALKYHVSYKQILKAEREMEEIPNLDPLNNVNHFERLQKILPAVPSMPPHGKYAAFYIMGWGILQYIDFFHSMNNDGEVNLYRTKTTLTTLYDVSNCVIHHLTVGIPYEYEYLGLTSVFLNTPLTEKAMLSLTHSLKNYQCGAIVGPSSVGKTETIKEFSRAFGQCLYHIKCGELVSSFQIKQYMNGLVTSGCWALFDSVNRLTKDVMCTLSHYLDQVQTAIRSLQSEKNSQYGLRGQSSADKKHCPSHSCKLTRRNSLTTLHSLEKEPTSENIMAPLNRQRSGTQGCYEKGLESFYGENWIYQKRSNRRNSSVCEALNIDLELYKYDKPSIFSNDDLKKESSCFDLNQTQELPSRLFHRKYIGNIKFDGQYLQASPSYGCFMTLGTTEAGYQDIPDNFRLLLRPFSLLTPDYQQIAQVYCLICGFEQHETMAKKLLVFINLFQTWLPRKLKFQVQNLSFLMSVLNTLKKHVAEVADRKYEEKDFLIEAIKEVFIPYLDEGRDKKQFWNLLQEVFDYVPKDNTKEDQFRQALQNQLEESHLKLSPAMISKMVELYKSCSLSLRSTIICGPSGSGKTLILKTLIQTLNMLSYKAAAIEKPDEEILPKQEADVIISKANHKINKRMQLLRSIISSVRPAPSTLNKAILKKKIDSSHFPRIYMSQLFPSSMPPQEFLGYYDSDVWKSGALWQELHKSSFSDAIIPQCDESKPEPIADTQVWLVFDGTLHSSWCDPVASLFDSSRKLILPNADSFSLKDETKLIVETDQLNDASPTMLNQCSVVFCSPSNFQWESLFNAWKAKLTFKCYMNNVGLNFLDELADAMIPATLKFLQSEKGITTALYADISPLDYHPTVVGVQEVTSFLTLLGILLEKALLKDHNIENRSTSYRTHGSISSEVCLSLYYQPDEHIPYYKNIIQALFLFAFIWAFGAHLHERNKDEFSDHVRQCLSKMIEPIPFPSDGSVFDYWVDESNGKFCTWAQKLSLTQGTSVQSSYVFISEFERYDFLIKLLLDNNIPVLISGNPGVGKTTFIKNIIMNQKTRRHCMSPLQTPDRFLEIILLREQWSSITTGKGVALSTSAVKRGKAMNSLKRKKAGQAHLIFIDDLNMAPKENGCQPTLELFRQVLTVGTVFDKRHHTDCNVKHLDFLAATTIPSAPGAGIDRLCHVMNSRFSRLFFNITFHTPTYDQLNTIYSCCVFTWLDELPAFFKDDPAEMAKAITLGTLELYLQIKDKLHASPFHPLYIFTLHEVARVFEGIKLFTPRTATQRLSENRRRTIDMCSPSPRNSFSHHPDGNLSNRTLPLRGTLIRLWAHECNRIFADRIIDREDYDWYLQCLHNLTARYFCKANPLPKLDMEVIAEENSQIETGSSEVSSSSEILSSTHIFSENGLSENFAAQDNQDSRIALETQAESKETTGTTTTATLADDGLSENSAAQDQLNSEIADKVTSGSNQVSSLSNEVEPTTNATSAEDRPDSEIASDNQTQRDTLSDLERTSESEREQDTDRQSSESSVKRTIIIKDPSMDGDSQSEGRRSSLSRTPSTDARKTPSHSRLVPLSMQKMAQTDFHGALMYMEDVKGELGSLDEVIFSRYILYTESSGHFNERGYTECTMTQLICALKKRINRYNEAYHLKWNLTLVDEFLPLIIRLTRILALPQGHGLLFRSSYQTAGRKALTRLAAYLAKAEVVEPNATNCDDKSYDDILEESFKLACQQAGVVGSPTVLIIPEIFAYNCNLTSISTLLAQGDCPNLYEEATKLSHLVQTVLSEKKNSVNKLTDEQMGKVFEIFFNRVKQNLHILIFLTLEDSGSNEFFERYPNLIKYSCSVTIQHPMSTTAYQQLALSWVQEEDIECLFPDTMDFGESVVDESVVLDTVSAAMAYIHQTAQTLVRQVYHNRKIFINYTVNHLRELVHIFKQMVMYIIEREKENISHYAGALGKVNEAYGSINDYRETICRLSPIHKTAVDSIQDNIADLAQKRAALKKLLSLSKEQEEKIKKLEILKAKMISAENKMFQELEPQYRDTLHDLKSINKDAWYELKKYRQPPDQIKKLLGCICLLFGKPITWEEGMSLMSDANFMNYITYYNKRELSDELYAALDKYLMLSDLKPQNMIMYSKAASSVCQWVCSVHRYSTLIRKNQPMKSKQAELEQKLVMAKETLAKLRRETKFCKTALAKNVKVCKESMKNAKAIEKQIENFEKKVADASNLMGNISTQHRLWKKEVTRANLHLSTSFGDGLLAAAYVCYCGPLDDEDRKKLLDDWIEHFELRTFTDVTDEKLYPKMYKKVLQCKCPCHSSEDHNSDPMATVKAYEAKVHKSEFNYFSDLMVDSSEENLDDITDYDSDEDETKKVLKIRKNFQLLKVLSSYEELSEWRMKNYPVDSRSLQNACLIKMCKSNFRSLWPLLVDPDDQAEQWVRNLHLSTVYRDNKSCAADSAMHSTTVSPSECASYASSTVDLLETTHATSPSLLQGLKYEPIDWTMEDRICVLSADDPLLESKIWNAVNYGQLLLVTHVGHQPLNPTLLWLLSCEKIEMEDYDETHAVLKCAKMTSPCHKDFFLFLSTNVPLNINGFDLRYFPLEDLKIIDLSLSNEAVMNRIMYETLQVENLDFEKQRRANETDIIQHRQQLFHEIALLREKTMNLEGPLIEDKTILESLLACQRNVERNRLIIDESCSKERHLEEIYAPFVPMVIEAATIYSTLKNIIHLHPCYFSSFDTFIKQFINGIQSMKRHCGEGEPKSRANELLNAATISIFEFVSMMMFEEHLTIFYLEFTLERHLQNKMATELEIGIFLNGFRINRKKIGTLLVGKPNWISEQAWTECFLLESMLEEFKGLRASLMFPFMSKQWKEYFKNSIILMNQVPDPTLKNLTIFQKSLLWKILCPDRFSELCHSLIVSELGNMIIPPDNYNIRNVYKMTQMDIPVLFLLPSTLREGQLPDGTQGFLFSDPVREVKRFAKEMDMDGRVFVANCTSQLTEENLKEIVTECFHNGYWLILQNYHMCSAKIHLHLASIMKIFLADDSPIQTSSVVSYSTELDAQPEENFRLWVTFALGQSNRGLPPACLIQPSMKVTCETSRNFQSTLLKCHRASKFLFHRYQFDHTQYQNLVHSKHYEIMALAVLHSLLIQHRCFTYLIPEKRAVFNQPCYWSLLDMASVPDFFYHWLPINNMQMLKKIADLVGGIYASHCIDEYDAARVKAFALDILKTMYLVKKKARENPGNVEASSTTQPDTASSCHTLKGPDYLCSESQLTPDLLSVLFSFNDTAKRSGMDADVRNQISIKGLAYRLYQKPDGTKHGSFFSDVHYKVYGLPAMAQSTLLQYQSWILSKEIHRLGSHESILRKTDINLADIFQIELTDILEQVTEKLNSLPPSPDHSKMVMLHSDKNFLLLEIQNYTQLFHLITKQVEVLKKHLVKKTGLTKEMLQVKKLLSKNEIPTPWLSYGFPSNLKLIDWLKKTMANMEYALSSVNQFSAFQPHDLGTFLRPDCLLSAIIQTYAWTNNKELIDLSIEGMVQDETDDPPPGAIILTNASLCNAKWHFGTLEFVESSTTTKSKDDEDCSCPKGFVYLKIANKSEEQSNQNFYLCPVFQSQKDLDLSKRNSLTEIPLPVTRDSLYFSGKKVHLHFSQDEDD